MTANLTDNAMLVSAGGTIGRLTGLVVLSALTWRALQLQLLDASLA